MQRGQEEETGEKYKKTIKQYRQGYATCWPVSNETRRMAIAN